MVDALEDPRPRHTQFGLSSSIGVTVSPMSSSSSSLLYASNAFDVDVRAMKDGARQHWHGAVQRLHSGGKMFESVTVNLNAYPCLAHGMALCARRRTDLGQSQGYKCHS